MLLAHLFEDAESDVRRSLNADKLFQSVTAHIYRLYKAGEKLPTAIYNGENVPCLPAEDFDASPFFRDVLLIFPNNTYAMGGKASQVQELIGGRYRFIVTVNVDGDTTEEIWIALRYDRVETVVRHELQHIIDFKRRKGDIFKTREPNFNQEDTLSTPEKTVAYHNSSAETNAYFHNLAEPLLKRIRFMQEHGVDMVGIFPDLPRDFRAYLTDHLSNKYGVLKRHWEALTEENRRKVFSRLSKLFTLYWKMLDAHAAEQAKYSETPGEVNV
jgi:hypothetical protein